MVLPYGYWSPRRRRQRKMGRQSNVSRDNGKFLKCYERNQFTDSKSHIKSKNMYFFRKKRRKKVTSNHMAKQTKKL